MSTLILIMSLMFLSFIFAWVMTFGKATPATVRLQRKKTRRY